MNTKIKGWTFLHWWVRPVVWLWFRIYHKSVTISEAEPIDWDKPIIFAPTHQNAFSDALCLILPAQYTNNHFIYPLVRADAFNNNFITDWILTSFHMLPVYRPRDNVNLKAENDSVFAACHDILSKNRNLLVHPEGNCIPKRQIRNFKKGVARIALGAENMNGFELGIQVIPVGINYRDITEKRKGIHIRYGSPLQVCHYSTLYQQNSALAIKQLTDDIKTGVKAVSVDIDSSLLYDLTEDVIKVSLTESSNPDTYTKAELSKNQDIAEKLKKLNHESPEIVELLNKKIGKLKKLMSQKGLKAGYLPDRSSLSTGKKFSELLLYIALSPVILYGFVHNFIPWFLMQRMSDRIKELQFKSSARMLAGLLLFPFFYLLYGILFFIITGSISWGILYVLSISLSGIVTLNLSERYQIFKNRMAISKLSKTNHSVFNKIYSLRDEIFSGLHSASIANPAKSEKL